MTHLPCPNCDELIDDAWIETSFASVGSKDDIAIKVQCVECGAEFTGTIRFANLIQKPDSTPKYQGL